MRCSGDIISLMMSVEVVGIPSLLVGGVAGTLMDPPTSQALLGLACASGDNGDPGAVCPTWGSGGGAVGKSCGRGLASIPFMHLLLPAAGSDELQLSWGGCICFDLP